MWLNILGRKLTPRHGRYEKHVLNITPRPLLFMQTSTFENPCMSPKTKSQIHDLRHVWPFKNKHLHLPLALVMTGTKKNTNLQISSYKITGVIVHPWLSTFKCSERIPQVEQAQGCLWGCPQQKRDKIRGEGEGWQRVGVTSHQQQQAHPNSAMSVWALVEKLAKQVTRTKIFSS
jgi:hypothetical protein